MPGGAPPSGGGSGECLIVSVPHSPRMYLPWVSSKAPLSRRSTKQSRLGDSGRVCLESRPRCPRNPRGTDETLLWGSRRETLCQQSAMTRNPMPVQGGSRMYRNGRRRKCAGQLRLWKSSSFLWNDFALCFKVGVLV